MSQALEIDMLDTQIIDELRTDARRSNVEIAQKLGITEGTVRRRIGRLIEQGIGKIIMAVDANKLGYRVQVLISLRVETDKLEKVVKHLAAYPEIIYVGLMTGDFNVQLHALLKTNDEVLALIQNNIAHIEGVKDIQTLYILKVVKRAYGWMPTEE